MTCKRETTGELLPLKLRPSSHGVDSGQVSSKKINTARPECQDSAPFGQLSCQSSDHLETSKRPPNEPRPDDGGLQCHIILESKQMKLVAQVKLYIVKSSSPDAPNERHTH